MSNLNRVTMIGRLTTDPELRNVGDQKQLVQCNVATNYHWKNGEGEWQEGVDFHRVVAWDRLGERVATAYQKGDQLFVEGKLRSRSWTTESGEKRWSTEVVAQRVLSMQSAAGKKAAEDASDEQEVVVVSEAAAVAA